MYYFHVMKEPIFTCKGSAPKQIITIPFKGPKRLRYNARPGTGLCAVLKHECMSTGNIVHRRLISNRAKIVVVRSYVQQSDAEVDEEHGCLPAVQTVCSTEETVQEGLELLDWPMVCNQVASYARTRAGFNACSVLPVGKTYEESENLMDQTHEARMCNLEFDGVCDISSSISLATQGRVLTGLALNEIASTLQAASTLRQILEDQKEGVPSLKRATFDELNAAPPLVEASIAACVGLGGVVLDSASEDLAAVRKLRKNNTQELRSMLNTMANKLAQQGGAERAQVVARRGRQCIPVRRGQQGLLPNKGVVLGESASGATLFMEPTEAVPFNNAEAELATDEDEIVQIILTELSNLVSVESKNLLRVVDAITTLDMAQARAAHAEWMEALRPQLVPPSNLEVSIHMESVLNPVLLQSALPPLPSLWDAQDSEREPSNSFPPPKSFKAKGDERASKPQPISFPVPAATRVVAITGPNTGGKTASLKTVGLCALMVKAGLFLPTAEPASMVWFDQVLVDLGDGQSLEKNLSTFSGHIRRLRNILAAMTPESLVLLDEVGSGTDPSEGAALAVSVLMRLAEGTRLTFATSHYAELKSLSAQDRRFCAAAVEFDVEALKPTYRLLWGEIGNSNALDIAAGLGLPPSILSSARQVMATEISNGSAENTGALLDSLQIQLSEQKSRTRRALSQQAELKSSIERMEQQVAELTDGFDQLCQDHKLKMEEKRSAVLKELERAASAPSSEADRQRRIDQLVRDFAIDIGIRTSVEQDGKQWMPSVGSQVQIGRVGNTVGEVVGVVGDGASAQVTVKMGRLEMRVGLEELRPAKVGSSSSQEVAGAARPSRTRPVAPRRQPPQVEDPVVNYSEGLQSAVQFESNTCDLRGLRVDEGMQELDLAINRRGGGHGYIFIVHGVGTGQMKKAVLEALKNHPMVTSFGANPGVGGDGCTIAYVQ